MAIHGTPLSDCIASTNNTFENNMDHISFPFLWTTMIQYQNLCMSTRLLDLQLSHLAFTFVRVCFCVCFYISVQFVWEANRLSWQINIWSLHIDAQREIDTLPGSIRWHLPSTLLLEEPRRRPGCLRASQQRACVFEEGGQSSCRVMLASLFM